MRRNVRAQGVTCQPLSCLARKSVRGPLHAELSFQASQLASLFMLYGLLCASKLELESRYRVGSFESGTLLCQAYEAYLEFHAPASIFFEHAWFLLLAL